MECTSSLDDRLFRSRFEACELPPPFSHRDHVRLAYVQLTESDVDTSLERVKGGLLRYLDHHGVDPAKYHETLTRAWIMAVRHFMELCPESESASALFAAKPRILNSKIMLRHYSPHRLFSQEARARFIAPDLLAIPTYGD